MSQYYSGKRTKNLYKGKSGEQFRLSRSKIENFLKCPRCFYIDRKLGVDQPPGYPFTLNTAVDTLLKKEFDVYRKEQTVHPLLKMYGIDAVPFQHPQIDEWRENFKGLQYYHEASGFLVTGAIDDIWQNSAGELHVVDYKATAKNTEVSIDAEWQKSYKNQIEVYQWLLRHQPGQFKVSDIGYFVYVNGKTTPETFNERLEFDTKIISYVGDDSWVEKALMDAKALLESDKLPPAKDDCDYCVYRKAVQDALTAFQEDK